MSSKSKRKVSGQDQEEKRKKDNKTKDKKAKLRKTRNREKVTIGKKAADQIRKRGKIRECEEDNVLDYEEETQEEQEEESGIKEKKDIERSMWSLGTGWKVDPRTENLRGPQLLDPAAQLFDDNSKSVFGYHSLALTFPLTLRVCGAVEAYSVYLPQPYLYVCLLLYESSEHPFS